MSPIPMSPPKPDYDPVNVGSLEFWGRTPEERDLSLRILRDERPLSWQRPAEGSMLPQSDGAGFWAVTRHADIVEVSKTPRDFSSAQGVIFEDVPDDILEAAQSFLGMDAPRHTQLRKLVSSAFTPRQVAKISQQIRDQARRLVDRLIDTGDCDFVAAVARPLPMWTIYEMVGLPDHLREQATDGADGMVSWGDDDVRAGREPAEVINDALVTLITVGLELAELRRATPGDDLMTNLVQAEVDGQRLTDEEIAAFFVLLSVAGNDTTRNSTSIGLRAFTDFPDQRKILTDDLSGTLDTAVEEIVRWATPVMTFRRTATRDLELHAQQISAGDWVALFYNSGNRDERAFTDPHTFDVRRRPNNHVGFGGGGPHFCLGAMLARTQLRSIFTQLLTRVPHIEAGEPVRLGSNFMDAVKSMPATIGRPA